jgi:hypothetical protein
MLFTIIVNTDGDSDTRPQDSLRLSARFAVRSAMLRITRSFQAESVGRKMLKNGRVRSVHPAHVHFFGYL